MVTVAKQRQSVRLESETDRATRKGETVIGGGYATRHVVLMPGAENSATGVSLMSLMERIHSAAAVLPGQKCYLLMTLVSSLSADVFTNSP